MGCVPSQPASERHLQRVDSAGRRRVRPLGWADMDQAVNVMGRSFAGSATSAPEGSFDWALGPALKEQWDDPRRLRLTSWYTKWCLVTALQFGGVAWGVCDEEDESGALLGVFVALPPGRAHVHNSGEFTCRMLRTALTMGGGPPDTVNVGQPDGYSRGTSARMQSMGPALHPLRERHWYIWIAAVAPEAQGKGVSRQVFDVFNRLADLEDLPCYLLTHGERNIAIYSKFGYQINKHIPVNPGEDALEGQEQLTFTAMLRPRSSQPI